MTARTALLGLAAVSLLAVPALAEPVLNQPAPAFTAKDADGKTRSLAGFKGKTVVMEWTNNGCPYVRKHYDSKNMQGLQSRATKDGVVWLTVVSSAPGQQGFVDGAGAKAWKAKEGASSSAVLLDPTGAVGKLYGAKTTPHMYVVDKAGKLVYMGGIDDKATNKQEDIAGAKNYVTAALADVKAGRKVAQPVTKPYGCSVKYG